MRTTLDRKLTRSPITPQINISYQRRPLLMLCFCHYQQLNLMLVELKSCFVGITREKKKTLRNMFDLFCRIHHVGDKILQHFERFLNIVLFV